MHLQAATIGTGDIEKGGVNDPYTNYGASKAANWMLAHEMGQRYKKDGIISICQNPGNLSTHIYDSQSRILIFFVHMILYPPKMGAYTELFAGLADEITDQARALMLSREGGYRRGIRGRIFIRHWMRERGNSSGTSARLGLKRTRDRKESIWLFPYIHTLLSLLIQKIAFQFLISQNYFKKKIVLSPSRTVCLVI